jgi:hypothetical protein
MKGSTFHFKDSLHLMLIEFNFQVIYKVHWLFLYPSQNFILLYFHGSDFTDCICPSLRSNSPLNRTSEIETNPGVDACSEPHSILITNQKHTGMDNTAPFCMTDCLLTKAHLPND